MRAKLTGVLVIAAMAAVVLAVGGARSAYAGSITKTFNFDSLASSSGDNSAAVAALLDTTLGCGSCATVMGAATDHTYNGEGYVVGPSGHSFTLNKANAGPADGTATSEIGYNSSANHTFLANTTDGSTQISQTISIQLSGFQITAVSFDYEIFPDGSCPNKNNCGTNGSNLPDLTFGTNLNSNVFTYYGVVPGTGTATPQTAWSTTNGYVSYTQSPNDTTEQAPQLLGSFSGTGLGGVNTLYFNDWPATIGVSNLSVTYNGPAPEAGTPALLAITLVGVGLMWRRQASA